MRSYLPADHELKHLEIGSEATPAAFLDTLLQLTAEWRRLLAPHGSICVELGDTYSGSGGAGGDWIEGSGERVYKRGDDIPDFTSMPPRKGTGWPLAKSLCAIPQLYEASLAYGRNLLTGQPSPAGQWRVRNVVAWCRPNPPVGALGDKFRPATSYLTIACVSDRRYFDLDAVRVAYKHPDHPQVGQPTSYKAGLSGEGYGDEGRGVGRIRTENPAGAPPLDWWNIPTHPFSGAHYATFPPALCVKPILAMCPQRVCTVCGEPSKRLTQASYSHAASQFNGKFDGDYKRQEADAGVNGAAKFAHGRAIKNVETLGWSDCQHDSWRNGLILDPFAGSGTTLAVATGHGRDAIGIDLDPRNADLAQERVGMFLEVDASTGEPGV